MNFFHMLMTVGERRAFNIRQAQNLFAVIVSVFFASMLYFISFSLYKLFLKLTSIRIACGIYARRMLTILKKCWKWYELFAILRLCSIGFK